jgi:DNA-binding SARP family transcriptional activator
VEFRVLGPLEVRADDGPLSLGAPKQRAVLAALILRRNAIVSTATLVNEVWGERPPASVAKILQGHVWQLRRALGATVIETQPLGYLLRVERGALDLDRFEELIERGRALLRSGAVAEAAAALREALGLWRGPPFADFSHEAFARNEIARLTDLRLVALEQRFEADLAFGHHADSIPELEALVREHPLRESLRALLMLALYRAGRQADALASYQQARQTLVEELGLEPGQALQRLEQQILRQDPALDLAPPPPAAESRPASVPSVMPARKTVTVLSAGVDIDVADPELVERARSGFAESAAALLGRHGATVDTAGAETVTAVFGVPAVHEDDALRAVRAATELRAAHPRCRIGLVTGEVLTAAGERIATGEPMTLAAKLERTARLGEVLLSAETLPLVGGAVDVALDSHRTYRLLALKDVPERGWRAPMVGRVRESAQLAEAFAALASGRSRLFTILGDAGVGKSRLVGEFLAGVDAAVVRGRCLPYGEGITYRPIVEVLGQVGARPVEQAAASVIASLLGESDAPATADEIAWAVRKTFEQAAAERPLVVVLDDIHWGEDAFLDLVEYIADFARDSPLLLVCMSRPELYERRPGWGGGKPNATTILLEPLAPAEADELIASLAPADEALHARVREAAGGNPLFIEEMLAFARETGDRGVAAPPTIRALLAARLDQLEGAERAVLQCGAVEGEVFHRGPVAMLTPVEGDVTPLLMALVRKELIRFDRAEFPGEEAYRFRHLLLRDAAYDALPKATRADLHERFADWLDHAGADLVERDELVGYHLEQAHRYRTELGSRDESLGERAARHLAAAGHRAAARGDYRAAANLLQRALALGLGDRRTRAHTQVELGWLLGETHWLEQAASVLDEALAAATSLGDRGLAALARLKTAWLTRQGRSLFDPEQMRATAQEAIATFDELGDERGLGEAWYLLAGAEANGFGRWTAAREGYERALEHAGAADDVLTRNRAIAALTSSLCAGPTPVEEAIRRCQELRRLSAGQPFLEARIDRGLGWLYAMGGRRDDAREAERRASGVLDELGSAAHAEQRMQAAGTYGLLGENAAVEEQHLAMWRYFAGESEGASNHMAALAATNLAAFYCGEGRWDEAERWLARANQVPAPRGSAVTPTRLSVAARLAAHHGELSDALTLARQANEAAEEQVDRVHVRAGTWLVLAEVLRQSGQTAEADAAVEKAIGLYERKRNVAAIARLRAGELALG